ncbi:hypothetical protein HMPREF0072_0625, partial [Anaerococcus lactolyticus ATCC 51172]
DCLAGRARRRFGRSALGSASREREEGDCDHCCEAGKVLRGVHDGVFHRSSAAEPPASGGAAAVEDGEGIGWRRRRGQRQ